MQVSIVSLWIRYFESPVHRVTVRIRAPYSIIENARVYLRRSDSYRPSERRIALNPSRESVANPPTSVRLLES